MGPEAPAYLRIQVLGALHEWLLEQQLEVDWASSNVRLVVRPGHQRRTTGSYFTPPALVHNLLDLCLEPELDARLVGATPAETRRRLLELRLVDPACGSGMFLLAALARLARRLQPITDAALTLTELVSHCLYGVNIDATAVDLCRLSLWLECGPPFEPLPSLKQHIRCGNSIFGAWPDFAARGVSDRAFAPGPDDVAASATVLKLRNRRERRMPTQATGADNSAAGSASPSQLSALADLWCAAYVWPKRPGVNVPTHAIFAQAVQGGVTGGAQWQAVLTGLVERYQFFHWHLQFPEVFGHHASNGARQRNGAGFDFVIGNPPWVAHAGRSTQRLPWGHKLYLLDNFVAFAGYPTTHGVFVELAARLLNDSGRIGLVLPASVADLEGYIPTRKAHDELCVLSRPLPDYGEGRFVGVTQPSIALVSQRRTPAVTASDVGQPWPLERSDLDAEGSALLERLGRMAPLPRELFGERGFQSTPTLRRHISEQPRPTQQYSLALREGTDIREFCRGQVRHYADPCLFEKGLRPLAEFAVVSLLVRQTARYPIAAKNDGAAFRNSLLAVLQHAVWPWSLMLCLLNSALIRWNHYFRFRDGRQPILPQLKVSHLRSIPAPISRTLPAFARLAQLGVDLAERNRGVDDDERQLLDACVGEIYGLSDVEQRRVTEWHLARPR